MLVPTLFLASLFISLASCFSLNGQVASPLQAFNTMYRPDLYHQLPQLSVSSPMPAQEKAEFTQILLDQMPEGYLTLRELWYEWVAALELTPGTPDFAHCEGLHDFLMNCFNDIYGIELVLDALLSSAAHAAALQDAQQRDVEDEDVMSVFPDWQLEARVEFPVPSLETLAQIDILGLYAYAMFYILDSILPIQGEEQA